MIVFLIGKLLVVNLSGERDLLVAGIKSWTTGLLLRGREYCSVSIQN
jgi:hypothetical protein